MFHEPKKANAKGIKRIHGRGTGRDARAGTGTEGRSPCKQGQGRSEKEVLAATAKMPEPDRSMAKRLHAIIKASAPQLTPRTWYGMPAYAKDDKIVCYFRPAYKFKDRYATFGFNDKANLDAGAMWPTAFALQELTAAVEARIIALVKKAAS